MNSVESIRESLNIVDNRTPAPPPDEERIARYNEFDVQLQNELSDENILKTIKAFNTKFQEIRRVAEQNYERTTGCKTSFVAIVQDAMHYKGESIEFCKMSFTLDCMSLKMCLATFGMLDWIENMHTVEEEAQNTFRQWMEQEEQKKFLKNYSFIWLGNKIANEVAKHEGDLICKVTGQVCQTPIRINNNCYIDKAHLNKFGKEAINVLFEKLTDLEIEDLFMRIFEIYQTLSNAEQKKLLNELKRLTNEEWKENLPAEEYCARMNRLSLEQKKIIISQFFNLNLFAIDSARMQFVRMRIDQLVHNEYISLKNYRPRNDSQKALPKEVYKVIKKYSYARMLQKMQTQ